jgi:hypothetical protein
MVYLQVSLSIKITLREAADGATDGTIKQSFRSGGIDLSLLEVETQYKYA